MARRLLTLPAALLLAPSLGQSPAQAASFGDPVRARKGADPWIVNRATGKVADVADCSTADSADVRRWTWLNNACRQWRISPV
ncbi:hypothetical protein GCM10019016_040570 [Streptomyces prasinosporus]|uniref:Ricin B lectin domain-containing protein n=1 Tax=Streptomyces prasinosporus TaxID=68256 RepID=A0ABP6TNR8_9ACTN